MNLSKEELEIELEKRQTQIDHLKQENEKLAGILYSVNGKLYNSERLKGHFISNITNEIINPFSSVLALAENIRHLKEGEMSKAHRMAGLIFEEAFHLDFQLKNIYAAALIEAGKEEPKPVVVVINELGDQVSQYFSHDLNKKSIRLSVSYSNLGTLDSLISMRTDREKVSLILKNLISNSIKYSAEGSEINLDFAYEKGQLEIKVSDHGKGISKEDRNVVFDRFKQLDEKINSINTGHGLGLSIVKAYAELLGGEVCLTDHAGGGTCVSVCIPESAESESWNDLDDFLLTNESF